jgi:hypothetical protein
MSKLPPSKHRIKARIQQAENNIHPKQTETLEVGFEGNR